jgi:GrpB-like predicted nucleotidyltransferase (UPF0157 family)
MLTSQQKKWLEHLRVDDHTSVTPYDPKVKEVFLKVQQELQEVLGPSVSIQLRGSSALGIGGKGELDVYIPVDSEVFAQTLKALTQKYGTPGSHYPLERARFNLKRDGALIELFLINNQAEGWINLNMFEEYLLAHPDELRKYEQLKESLEGKSTQEYYTVKLEFFNQILEKAELDRK